MKLRTVINALPALQKLSAQDFTPRTLYGVRKLISKLETEVKFFNDEKEKIVAKYRDKGGKLSEQDIKEIDKELAAVLDVEIECEIKKPVIPDSENYKLSNNDIEQLKDLVDFTFDESENQ